MSLIEHAKQELAFLKNGDEMNDSMADDVLAVVEVFANQGHSGFSAGYAIQCLEKLLRYQPLRPLTGEDNEWNEVGEGVFQNKRSSRVFKENGIAYDIDGKVFEDEKGCRFTSRDSRVNVTFPYSPTTEYVKTTSVEAVNHEQTEQ